LTYIFAHPVYLWGIQVKFVYEGHRVKVKVTEAKKVENPYSRSIGNNAGSIKHRAMKFALSHEVFGYYELNDVTAIFVMWPEVTTRN